MKTIRPILSALAALAVLAVLGACAQVLAPQRLPGGNAGQVHLTVSAGPEKGARTILPKATPDFSRYALDFTRDGTTISAADTADIAGTGVTQELDSGTWTAAVKAYRRFTPSGGSDTEYLAARGSAEVTVATGQLATVTVPLVPVSITDTAVKGIFTYTVSYPDTVTTATLTLGGAIINQPLTSGATVSLEVDPGYYDLTISLTNSYNTTAGASEKVHIYSGLESAAAYNFTAADFAQTLRLEGTVTLPGDVSIAGGSMRVYGNSVYTNLIQTEAIPAGGTAWAIGVGAGYYAGLTFYFKLDVLGSDGNIYTATGDTGGAVTAAGMKGITLNSVSQTTPTFLAHNVLATGTLDTIDQIDWYTLTAGTAGTYSLQLYDRSNSAGSYTGYAYASAYRANGTAVYFQSLTLAAGETVYVMVLPQSNIYFAGTYAIRYYNPAALPPQTAPSEVRVTGLPEAANAIVITWNSMSEVTGYEVSRSDTVEGTYTLIETMTGEYLPNFYTDNDVTTGATYWYKVNAENAHGSGPDSTPVSGSLSAASPSALPNNAGWAIGTLESGTQTDWYTLTAGTAGTYFLQWDDLYNSTGSYTTYVMVSAYRANGIPIFRNTASGYTNPRYLSFGTGETIYVIVASLSGYTGDYAIRYYDPAAVPPQTASLSVQTTGLPPPINGIAIRWNTVDGATDYKIFRSDSEMGTYTSIVTVPHEYPYTYTDIDVTTSVTYWYKVKAVNTYGSGPASAAVSGALSNASPTALPNDATWATGDLITGTQTDWYTLTPGTAGTYYLQGYDHDNSAGSYTAYTSVSAYRANGSLVFGPVGNSSRPLTLDEGETVYVMVATLNSWQTGTYALRYYQ